mmetsp:Transcript_21854/g.49817  ORF Transcript_21854/g.49817 Transcript_21854/m.49817 type:complete len:791 (-) Transcript_21854:200-2572(-)
MGSEFETGLPIRDHNHLRLRVLSSLQQNFLSGEQPLCHVGEATAELQLACDGILQIRLAVGHSLNDVGLLGELDDAHLHLLVTNVIPIDKPLHKLPDHIVPFLSPRPRRIDDQHNVQLGFADGIRRAVVDIALLALIPDNVQLVGASAGPAGRRGHVLHALLAPLAASLAARLPLRPLGELAVRVARVRVALLSLGLWRASLATEIRASLNVTHAGLQTAPALLRAAAPLGPLSHGAVDGARELVALLDHLQRRALDAQGHLLRYGSLQDLASSLATLATLLGSPVSHYAIHDQIRGHAALGEFSKLPADLAEATEIHHDLTNKVGALGVDFLELPLQLTLLPLLVNLGLRGLRLLAGRITKLGVALLEKSVPQGDLLVDSSAHVRALLLRRHQLGQLLIVAVLHLSPKDGHVVVEQTAIGVSHSALESLSGSRRSVAGRRHLGHLLFTDGHGWLSLVVHREHLGLRGGQQAFLLTLREHHSAHATRRSAGELEHLAQRILRASIRTLLRSGCALHERRVLESLASWRYLPLLVRRGAHAGGGGPVVVGNLRVLRILAHLQQLNARRHRCSQCPLERRGAGLLQLHVLALGAHHHVGLLRACFHRHRRGSAAVSLQQGGCWRFALSELHNQGCSVQIHLDNGQLGLQSGHSCLALGLMGPQSVLAVLDVLLGILDASLGLYDPLLFVGQLGAQPTQISNDNILRHCILVLELLTLHHRDVQLGDLPLHHAIDNTTRVVQFVLGQALGSVTLVLAQGSKHTLGNLVPHVLEHRLQGDAVHGRVEMGSLMLP